MFNLIKREVKAMAKTVDNMISNNIEVELAKLKIVDGYLKGVGNALKDPHARRVIGVVGIAVSVGLIASSYV